MNQGGMFGMLVSKAFNDADKDKSGFIDREETEASLNKFAKDLSQEGLGLSAADMDKIEKTSYFDYTLKPTLDGISSTIHQTETPGITNLKNLYSFECNDTMAEELISLAVSFALENVESTRLNSKLNMRGLEA